MNEDSEVSILQMMSRAKNLYAELNLKLKDFVEGFYKKESELPSEKDKVLLLINSLHSDLTKLRSECEGLRIKEDYRKAHNTLLTVLYHFERAAFLLSRGMTTLSWKQFRDAERHALNAIKLGDQVEEQYISSSTSIETPLKDNICPECGGELRRIVANWQIILGCLSCGCSEVEKDIEPTPSGIRDHWDGVIDNIERLLEDRVSRRGWS